MIGDDVTVFMTVVKSLFTIVKLAVEVIALSLGTLTLWLDFPRITERAGLVERLMVLFGPLFRRLVPKVPPEHPAIGLITLDFAASNLGLDSAATLIGLKAIKALQGLNPNNATTGSA